MATLCDSGGLIATVAHSFPPASVAEGDDGGGQECLHSLIGTLLMGFQEIKEMVDGTEVQLESVIAEGFGVDTVSGYFKKARNF